MGAPGAGPDPAELAGAVVLVAGAGVTGVDAATVLTGAGANVTVCDGAAPTGQTARALAAIGAPVVDVDTAIAGLADTDLIVTSPGWRPGNPLAAAALAAGVPVWGDVELAWRMDSAGVFGPPRTWLAVTGTNGKTTTVSMLEKMLQAAGMSAVACGNIGLPVLSALRATPRIEVLAVELSSFQLHWAPSVRPAAGVVLNIAEDHLDWHGSMARYTDAKAGVLTGTVAVVGLDDPAAAALAGTAPADRVVGFRLTAPGEGELGVASGELIDRAFTDEPGGVVLAPLSAVRPAGPAGTADALAAAALARAAGAPASAIARGLADHRTGPHRAETVAVVDQVTYIDDSKATNPHAARGSLLGRGPVVWIAGGLLKGADVTDLVAEVGPTLRAAVLLGRDRGQIAAALARHAPQVPVVDIATGDDGPGPMIDARTEDAMVTTIADSARPGSSVAVRAADADAAMSAAVALAARLARPGETVVLAPAAASLDMFVDYTARGRAFAAAVAQLTADGAAR